MGDVKRRVSADMRLFLEAPPTARVVRRRVEDDPPPNATRPTSNNVNGDKPTDKNADATPPTSPTASARARSSVNKKSADAKESGSVRDDDGNESTTQDSLRDVSETVCGVRTRED
jgi:hypothetical protein